LGLVEVLRVVVGKQFARVGVVGKDTEFWSGASVVTVTSGRRVLVVAGAGFKINGCGVIRDKTTFNRVVLNIKGFRDGAPLNKPGRGGDAILLEVSLDGGFGVGIHRSLAGASIAVEVGVLTNGMKRLVKIVVSVLIGRFI
jgi:hypothetical protein